MVSNLIRGVSPSLGSTQQYFLSSSGEVWTQRSKERKKRKNKMNRVVMLSVMALNGMEKLKIGLYFKWVSLILS